MEELIRDGSKSFDSDSSSDDIPNSDDIPKPPHHYLSFFSKISADLRAHCTRNSGKEDYCDDIYEDIYSAPVSGRYSYYKDLVAVSDDQETSGFEFHEQSAPTPSEFHCSSACSGHLNSAVGIGPFEELFQVLKPSHQPCSLSVPGTNTSTCCPRDVETTPYEALCNSSLDDGYSDFIDIFHSWTSNNSTCALGGVAPDDFPTDFLPGGSDDF